MARRLLLVVFVSLSLSVVFGTSARAVQPDEAAAFVDSAIQDVYTAMAGKHLSHEERVAILDSMIHRYTNIEKMSETLIGSSWGRASSSDQAAFEHTLVAYMLALWSDPMGDITPGQKVSITHSVAHGDKVLVESAAAAPHEDPTYIEWTVASAADGHPFIADVSVEGVSLVRVMKSDFSAVLFANSGHLDGLIAGMQRKIRAVN